MQISLTERALTTHECTPKNIERPRGLGCKSACSRGAANSQKCAQNQVHVIAINITSFAPFSSHWRNKPTNKSRVEKLIAIKLWNYTFTDKNRKRFFSHSFFFFTLLCSPRQPFQRRWNVLWSQSSRKNLTVSKTSSSSCCNDAIIS